jgi:hypothetical protein
MYSGTYFSGHSGGLCTLLRDSIVVYYTAYIALSV